MNFKTTDLAKIEIFSPGTAGERAIRLERKDGEVVIIDERDAESIIISGPPKPQVIFSIVQPAEGSGAFIEISYSVGGEWLDAELLAESMDQAIDTVIPFLKIRGFSYPAKEDLDIEFIFPAYYSTHWESHPK